MNDDERGWFDSLTERVPGTVFETLGATERAHWLPAWDVPIVIGLALAPGGALCLILETRSPQSMPTNHIVQSGECLSLIAANYGFTSWKTIYDAPANADFRRKRPNPNVIYPGDVLVIPDRDYRTEPNRGTEKRHSFRLKGEKWVFRIAMKDENGGGIEGEPFQFQVAGAPLVQGRTGPKGLIEVPVQAAARSATLKFLGERLDVRFGMLDPISTVKGVQERLNNLGFNSGAVDGIVGPITRKAVYAFQTTQPDLRATGDIDDVTRARLLQIHDNDRRLVAAEEDMGPQDPPQIAKEPPETGGPPESDAPSYGESQPWHTKRRGYTD
jgi:hypothetical protein